MHKFISQTLRRAASVLATAVLLLQTTMPLVAAASHQPNNPPNGQNGQKCYDDVTEYKWERKKWVKEVKHWRWNSSRNAWVEDRGDWNKVPENLNPPKYGEVNEQGTLPQGTYGIPEATPYRYVHETTDTKWSVSKPEGDGWTNTGKTRKSEVEVPCPKSSIKIVKDSVPNHPQDFGFKFDKKNDGKAAEAFFLDDDATDTLSNSKVFDDLDSGEYVITEDYIPDNWSLKYLSCESDKSRPDFDYDKEDSQVKIKLRQGENVVCTFTNHKKGTITIIKHVQSQNESDEKFKFEFDPEGYNNSEDFYLDDNNQSNTPKDKRFVVDNNKTYEISEDHKYGWDLKDIVCSGATNSTITPSVNNRKVSIKVKDNEDITCEFFNRPSKGTLIVEKRVVGGTADVSDFWFELKDGGQDYRFESDGINEFTALHDGFDYNVTEVNIPKHYTPSYSEGCVGQIVGGQTQTCIITNTYNKPSTLTLKKHVINDDGGTAWARDWRLKAQAYGQAPVIDQNGQTVWLPGPYGSWAMTQTKEVEPGVKYVLSEYGNKAGYKAGEWTCYGGGVLETKYGKTTVTVGEGEDVTCWITNDDIAPKVTVKKVAYGGHGWEKFEFKLDQPGPWNDKHFWLGNMQSKTFDVKPGLVQIFEKNLPDNWELTGDSCLEKKHGKWVPMGAGTDFIAVLGGEYKCTFTNDKDGEVHGHKFNDRNANGKWDKGEEGLKDWTINLYQKTCQPRDNVQDKSVAATFGFEVKHKVSLVDCAFGEEPYMTTTTKWNGSYKFTGVDLNRWYKVCEVQQDGWTQTKPNPDWFDGCYFIYVDRKSRVHVHKNFGNVEHVIEVELTPVCEAGFPYLNWKVTAHHFTPTQFTFDWYTNPGNVHVPGATTSVMANDSSVTKNGNVYTGSILWPGANPVLPDWPGWTFVNGQWVEDPSDFGGNLRPNAKVMVSINPTTTAEVAYPPAESGCDPTNPQVLGTDTLANTGSPALLSIIAALTLVVAASYVVVGRKQN